MIIIDPTGMVLLPKFPYSFHLGATIPETLLAPTQSKARYLTIWQIQPQLICAVTFSLFGPRLLTCLLPSHTKPITY